MVKIRLTDDHETKLRVIVYDIDIHSTGTQRPLRKRTVNLVLTGL